VADCIGVAHDRDQWRTVLVWLMIGSVADCTRVAHDRIQWRTVLVWLMRGERGGLYW
jgi:hypothetical protein